MDGGSKELHGVLSVGSDRWRSPVLGFRIVVPKALRRPLASCCGSGNVDLFRRCGVSSASCCGSGPLRHSGTGNINWVITFVDASWRATPLVVGLSRADRSHHVPTLAVTSGGRGVGFDVASSGTARGFSRVLRRQLNSNFQVNSNSYYTSSCTVAGCATGEVEPSRTARQSVSRTTPVTGF